MALCQGSLLGLVASTGDGASPQMVPKHEAGLPLWISEADDVEVMRANEGFRLANEEVAARILEVAPILLAERPDARYD